MQWMHFLTLVRKQFNINCESCSGFYFEFWKDWKMLIKAYILYLLKVFPANVIYIGNKFGIVNGKIMENICGEICYLLGIKTVVFLLFFARTMSNMRGRAAQQFEIGFTLTWRQIHEHVVTTRCWGALTPDSDSLEENQFLIMRLANCVNFVKSPVVVRSWLDWSIVSADGNLSYIVKYFDGAWHVSFFI